MTNTNDSKYLVISKEEFDRGYNLNFTRFISQQQGFDYLQWSYAFRLLKQHFPMYQVEVSRQEVIENKVMSEEFARLAYDQAVKQLEAEIAKPSPNWKTQKALQEKVDSLTCSDRGLMLYCRIVDMATGKATTEIQYPVMTKKNDALINPDARDINDATQRGLCKAIAIFTGIGLRLFTREGIDLNNGNKNHPKFLALQKMNGLIDMADTSGGLPDNWEVPHFGMSLYRINELGKELTEHLKKGRQPNENTPQAAENAPAYKSWKKPQDALNWAKETLGIDDEAAAALLADTEADAKGSKLVPFYNRVIELANRTK
ncbi:Sak single strand annealing protein [Myxosarcina sp. GI1(2024)]